MMEMTQFSIQTTTKDELDRYKAQMKLDILKAFKKKRRIVTNDDVIKYLLINEKKKK